MLLGGERRGIFLTLADKITSEPAQALIPRIEALVDGGTRKFRDIAKAILDDPEAFIRGSNRETCQRLGASEPTLIRFCQSLGYKGASEFRIDLALAYVHNRRDVLAVEPLHQDRRLVNVAEKRAIARLAAEEVTHDRSLVIDSGSTAEFFARALSESPGKTIMTTSLTVAQILLDQGQHDVLLTGGRVRREARSLTGQLIPTALKHFRFDTFAMGADCADISAGLSTFDEDEAVVTRALMGAATRSIALIDQTKFAKARLHAVCRFDDLDCLITDLDADSPRAADLVRAGAKLRFAQPHAAEGSLR